LNFKKKATVVGFDVSDRRVSELKPGLDSTFEVSKEELEEATNLSSRLILLRLKAEISIS